MQFASSFTVATRRTSRLWWTGLIAGVFAAGPGPAFGAELEQLTLQAYEAYVDRAREAFLRVADAPLVSVGAASPLCPVADMGSVALFDDGRLVRVPRGLVHHWGGTVLIPGVTLDRVLATAQAYDDYAAIHRPIVVSRLMAREGNTFRIFARLKEAAGPVSVVLDVHTQVTYERNGSCAYSLASSTEIREVKNPGRADEQLLPEGRDSGYLWRANTFTRFVERGDGVHVELQTIGLTRAFPKLLGWFIEPIARRVGRSSVERTLMEFRDAVQSLRTSSRRRGESPDRGEAALASARRSLHEIDRRALAD